MFKISPIFAWSWILLSGFALQAQASGKGSPSALGAITWNEDVGEGASVPIPGGVTFAAGETQIYFSAGRKYTAREWSELSLMMRRQGCALILDRSSTVGRRPLTIEPPRRFEVLAPQFVGEGGVIAVRFPLRTELHQPGLSLRCGDDTRGAKRGKLILDPVFFVQRQLGRWAQVQDRLENAN